MLKKYLLYTETCSITDKLKKLDKSHKYRKPNFPEDISEYLGYSCLKKTKSVSRTVKTGDLLEKILLEWEKIEIKCTVNGPISFGPTESWSRLYIIKIFCDNFEIFMCNLSNKDPKWRNIKVSKTQTFDSQSNSKRRPRITFDKLSEQLTLISIYKGNIIETLQESSVTTRRARYRIIDVERTLSES